MRAVTEFRDQRERERVVGDRVESEFWGVDKTGPLREPSKALYLGVCFTVTYCI